MTVNNSQELRAGLTQITLLPQVPNKTGLLPLLCYLILSRTCQFFLSVTASDFRFLSMYFTRNNHEEIFEQGVRTMYITRSIYSVYNSVSQSEFYGT